MDTGTKMIYNQPWFASHKEIHAAKVLKMFGAAIDVFMMHDLTCDVDLKKVSVKTCRRKLTR